MADKKYQQKIVAFNAEQWKVIEFALAEHMAITGVKLTRSYAIAMICADWAKLMTEPGVRP